MQSELKEPKRSFSLFNIDRHSYETQNAPFQISMRPSISNYMPFSFNSLSQDTQSSQRHSSRLRNYALRSDTYSNKSVTDDKLVQYSEKGNYIGDVTTNAVPKPFKTPRIKPKNVLNSFKALSPDSTAEPQQHENGYNSKTKIKQKTNAVSSNRKNRPSSVLKSTDKEGRSSNNFTVVKAFKKPKNCNLSYSAENTVVAKSLPVKRNEKLCRTDKNLLSQKPSNKSDEPSNNVNKMFKNVKQQREKISHYDESNSQIEIKFKKKTDKISKRKIKESRKHKSIKARDNSQDFNDDSMTFKGVEQHNDRTQSTSGVNTLKKPISMKDKNQPHSKVKRSHNSLNKMKERVTNLSVNIQKSSNDNQIAVNKSQRRRRKNIIYSDSVELITKSQSHSKTRTLKTRTFIKNDILKKQSSFIGESDSNCMPDYTPTQQKYRALLNIHNKDDVSKKLTRTKNQRQMASKVKLNAKSSKSSYEKDHPLASSNHADTNIQHENKTRSVTDNNFVFVKPLPPTKKSMNRTIIKKTQPLIKKNSSRDSDDDVSFKASLSHKNIIVSDCDDDCLSKVGSPRIESKTSKKSNKTRAKSQCKLLPKSGLKSDLVTRSQQDLPKSSKTKHKKSSHSNFNSSTLSGKILEHHVQNTSNRIDVFGKEQLKPSPNFSKFVQYDSITTMLTNDFKSVKDKKQNAIDGHVHKTPKLVKPTSRNQHKKQIDDLIVFSILNDVQVDTKKPSRLKKQNNFDFSSGARKKKGQIIVKSRDEVEKRYRRKDRAVKNLKRGNTNAKQSSKLKSGQMKINCSNFVNDMLVDTKLSTRSKRQNYSNDSDRSSRTSKKGGQKIIKNPVTNRLNEIEKSYDRKNRAFKNLNDGNTIAKRSSKLKSGQMEMDRSNLVDDTHVGTKMSIQSKRLNDSNHSARESKQKKQKVSTCPSKNTFNEAELTHQSKIKYKHVKSGHEKNISNGYNNYKNQATSSNKNCFQITKTFAPTPKFDITNLDDLYNFRMNDYLDTKFNNSVPVFKKLTYISKSKNDERPSDRRSVITLEGANVLRGLRQLAESGGVQLPISDELLMPMKTGKPINYVFECT